MDLWELGAREAIRETVAGYAHFADSGRFDDLVALFTPTGSLQIGRAEPLRGRDAIHTFLAGIAHDLADTSSSRMIRHNVSNLRIDVVSPHEATGRCYFFVVTEFGVDHWGRYTDAYCPGPDGTWLIDFRTVRTDGRLAGGFAAQSGEIE